MSIHPTYKASGIEWLGDIPEHWEVKRLKDFAKVENGKDYKHVEVEDGGYPVFGSGGEFRRSSEFLYDNPSVLLGRKGTIDKPLFVTDAFWTVDTMFYTIIKPNVNDKFFFYLCKTIQFDRYTYGAALPSMTQGDLHTMNFCRPSLEEQTAIANYLDEKTSKLDQLIKNKKAQIAQLKEIRQIEINTAVTKGLNPNAKLKPSGVEWLDDTSTTLSAGIPENWEVKRLKDFAKVENGKDYKHVEVEEGGYPVFGSGGKFRRSSEFLYDNPSVLLGRKGTIDKPLFVTDAFWTVDTMFYTIIKPNVNDKFFFYLCKTIQFDRYTYGSALPSMTQGDLHTMNFCRPSLAEQTAIANYLAEKTSKIDHLVSNLENQIAQLEEVRKIEIFNAVTGKIKIV
jgi:type I restriction enzyme S subunit